MAAGEQRRDGYHHGNLREALIQAALTLMAERGLAGFAIAELARAVGVSPAAPYRHFRDRNAVVAEVARRGFEQLAAELDAAQSAAGAHPIAALERCAQAHLAFAKREPAVYAAMFDGGFPVKDYPEVLRAREAAFAVVRRGAQVACDQGRGQRQPPALMVALHLWSLVHGIAGLFVSGGSEAQGWLPMTPEELLEAGLLVYLQSLGFPTTA